MTRPILSPLFATDPLFTSGAEVGIAPRLDPGGAIRGQGILPESQIAARWLNYELGIHGDWITHLDSVQVHQGFKFTRTDLGVGASSLTKLTPVRQTAGIGTPASRQSMILVSGATSGGFPSFELLNDGTSPANLIDYGSGGLPISAPAADNSGVIFWGATGGLVKSSANGGTSSSTVSVTGLTANATWVGFTGTRYLVHESSTNKLFKATSLAGPWTSSTLAVGTVKQLLSNGTGTLVILAASGGSHSAYYSTDDGTTWNFGTSLGVTSGAVGGGWSDAFGAFLALSGDSGILYISNDGISWNPLRTVSALAGLPLGQNSVAVCGPAIAVITNRGINSINRYPYGIAYSFDLGATWNEVYFGSPLGANPITNLISANGRIYATDGASLYQSGILSAPPVLFAGV